MTASAAPFDRYRCLWSALEKPAGRRPDLCVWDGTSYVAVRRDCWMRRAEEMAGALAARGVTRGTPVACVLTNAFESLAALVGVWAAGGVVVSVPTLARGVDLAVYAEQVARILRQSGAAWLLVEDRYAAVLESHGRLAGRVLGHGELAGRRVRSWSLVGEDDVCFVQYSSGSTGRPKGCALTVRAISCQVAMLAEVLDVSEGERVVSWLPLSHDMGLFGSLMLHLVSGLGLVLGTPERFVRSPRTWMDDCGEFGAQLSAGPCFAVALAARAARTAPPREELALTRLVIGGERVAWSVLCDARETLGRAGLAFASLVPAYGLAEATLGVSMVRGGAGPRAVRIDGETWGAGGWVVSCGPALPGVELRIRGADGVGEIVVRSPSLARGYEGDMEATAERFRDGELRTGDIGFARDGELFVLGRTDEMVSLGGRNVHLGDVEAAAQIASVRTGACAAVPVFEGSDTRLVLVAEPRGGSGDSARIARDLRRTVLEATGVRVDRCLLLKPGRFPRTPSGKVQRHRCRELVAHGGDQAIGEAA